MRLKRIKKIVIILFAVAIAMALSIYANNNLQKRKLQKLQQAAKIQILDFELSKAQSDLIALKQNHCYTKDVKISKLNVVSLKLNDGQFVRGHDLFKDFNTHLRIQKFSKPVTYMCALGEYNLNSMYFFPDHNYYILDGESSSTKEISGNLSRHKKIAQLPLKDDVIN